MEESLRRSTSSREGTPGTGSSRAAMYRNYSVRRETKDNITAKTQRRREHTGDSSADRVHGAGRRDESGTVDFVADPFGLHVRTNEFCDLVVRCARAQQGFYVSFFDGEQAVAQFAIGGKANAIAIEAERPRYGRDEADPPAIVRVAIFRGRSARIAVRNVDQWGDFARQQPDHFVSTQHAGSIPNLLRIERHELDESRLDSAFSAKSRQGNDVGLG